jgi:hypothetical protein
VPSALRGRLLAPRRHEGKDFAWLRQPLLVARGRQVRLGAATGHELDLALERVVARLGPIRQRAIFLRLVREQLPDPGKRVDEVLDDGQLQQLWARADQELAREDQVAAMAQQAMLQGRSRATLPPPLTD